MPNWTRFIKQEDPTLEELMKEIDEKGFENVGESELKVFGICPFCQIRIQLFDRKDFESLSKIEVFHHLLRDHYEEYDKWTDENHKSGFLPYTRVEFEN